jgi:DNA-binding NarL/FixJ family response regulator
MGDSSEDADALQRCREAYGRRAWEDAYRALARADRSGGLDLEHLELLAWAAGLTGRDAELLDALERLYHAALDAGDGARAAYYAFWSGMRLFSLGEVGRAGGWLARSQRLVDREEKECAVGGYLLLPAAHRSLGTGDVDAARAAAATAAEIGERFGDADLVAFARTLEGRARLRQGRVGEGLALLDEAMLAATSDELSPLIAGLVYCSVIATCQEVFALGRAREWTAALSRFCREQPQLVTFTGTCLVHRAEILQLGGDWRDALSEARRASEMVSGATDPAARAAAFYLRGEIHRLRGEHEAAEEAYRKTSEAGREPQPGLALLRLAQGNRATAAGAIRRVLGATTERWARARFLPAAVETFLVAGETDEAERACAELEAMAAGVDVEVLHAVAAHARGAVLLSRGDAQAALEPLRRAFAAWQQLGAPYLAARLRVLVAEACQALGDPEGAELELDAAGAVFAELGAQPDLVAVEAFRSRSSRGKGAGKSHGLTGRELEVLRLVTTGKTNKEIARHLGLSEKTVDRHLSNIFLKLNVPSRAAATAFAYENELF